MKTNFILRNDRIIMITTQLVWGEEIVVQERDVTDEVVSLVLKQLFSRKFIDKNKK